jgi:YaiO family outer membrane protein
MIRRITIALILLFALSAQPVLAACQPADPPAKTLDAELGATSDSLTGNRQNWDEQYLTLSARDGTQSEYASVTDDQRFGLRDTTYEAGTYFSPIPHLNVNAIASFSPTHLVLPESTFQGGVDLRAAGGYGYQGEYTQRNYSGAVANIASIGSDRYVRNKHLSALVTLVHLSNVPGLAASAGVVYAQYLRCDDLKFSLSSGRDVESTGVGANVALFHMISYDANDLHWITPHLALNVGAGWYLLTGAYDRFEVRLALHERF